MLEPQLSLSVLRVSNGSSETLLNATLASQVAYMFSGASVSSGYLGGNLALTVIDVSGADSENDFALGFAVGYRAPPHAKRRGPHRGRVPAVARFRAERAERGADLRHRDTLNGSQE